MSIPFVIDNQQHRMADALNELLTQSVGKPLVIARTERSALAPEAQPYQDLATAFCTAWQG
jgi:hypothetical protein